MGLARLPHKGADPDDIIIDPELEAKLPPTSDNENMLLEAQLLKNHRGPRDPLVLWDGTNILVDGHRRLAICKKHGLPFKVRYIKFESRDEVIKWMLELQLARRNLADYQRAVLIKELHTRMTQNSSGGDVATMVAKRVGTTRRTVFRALSHARAIECLHPSWQIQAKQMGLNRTLTIKLAKLSLTEQEYVMEQAFSGTGRAQSDSEIESRIRKLVRYSKPVSGRRVVMPDDTPESIVPALEVDIDQPAIRSGKAAPRMIRLEAIAAQQQLTALRKTVDKLTSPMYVGSSVLRSKSLSSIKQLDNLLQFIIDRNPYKSAHRKKPKDQA